MSASAIKRAAMNLRLIDVALHQGSFRQPGFAELVDDGANVLAQHKRAVSFATGQLGETEVFQAMVALGVRMVPEQDQDRPIIIIEADFRVVYEILTPVDESDLAAFADHNCVHNVWPFWRQHVFDIVGRARLPNIEIPLYSGDPPDQQALQEDGE